jgi:hypothetical protein
VSFSQDNKKTDLYNSLKKIKQDFVCSKIKSNNMYFIYCSMMKKNYFPERSILDKKRTTFKNSITRKKSNLIYSTITISIV